MRTTTNIIRTLGTAAAIFAATVSATPSFANNNLMTVEELKSAKVFYSLEEALKTPESVIKLSLYDNALLILPSVVKEFKNLQVLDISNNYITSLPAEIGQLSSLQYLNIEGNDITALPAEIGQLSNLKVLNARKNILTSVPSTIAQLNSLEVLNLSFNNITAVPAEIGKLANLSELNLQNNKIEKLPSAIGMLSSLKSLNVKYNSISSYPEEMAQLSGLASFEFDLHNLSIREIKKVGNALITTNTEAGRRALQTASFVESGDFSNFEIHVDNTAVQNGTYTSAFHYNHITKRDVRGTGTLTWTVEGGNVVVISYSMN